MSEEDEALSLFRARAGDLLDELWPFSDLATRHGLYPALAEWAAVAANSPCPLFERLCLANAAIVLAKAPNPRAEDIQRLRNALGALS